MLKPNVATKKIAQQLQNMSIQTDHLFKIKRKRPTYGDNTNNQQTEARQENGGNEVTRYLPHPTTESIPSTKQVDSWFLFSDVGEDLHVDEPMLAQPISLKSTINGLNNMEIGDGDGITVPQPLISSPHDSPTGNAGKTIFACSTGGFGLRLSPGSPAADDSPEGISSTSQPGISKQLLRG